MFTVQASESFWVVKALAWYSSHNFARSLFIVYNPRFRPYFYGKHIQAEEWNHRLYIWRWLSRRQFPLVLIYLISEVNKSLNSAKWVLISEQLQGTLMSCRMQNRRRKGCHGSWNWVWVLSTGTLQASRFTHLGCAQKRERRLVAIKSRL